MDMPRIAFRALLARITPALAALMFATSAFAHGPASPHTTPAESSKPTLAPGPHQVELNGVLLHYEVWGAGPVLIAYSGGPGMDARTWGDLAGLGEVATIVLLHPRGSGLSGRAPDSAYRLEHHVADLHALRAHLGVARPVIIGWSHGGIVAQRYAIDHPEGLSKLILFSTSAMFSGFLGDIEAAVKSFENKPWYEDAYAALQDEWAGNFDSDEEMNELLMRELPFYFADFDEQAAAYVSGLSELVPVRAESLKVFNEQEIETLDLREALQGVHLPTLILAGRHDFITTVAMAEEMHRALPDSRLVIFEESGHFALVEERERFHAVVSNFLTGGLDHR
jgi:proline iminopeptidase